jgi:hypothetical protein
MQGHWDKPPEDTPPVQSRVYIDGKKRPIYLRVHIDEVRVALESPGMVMELLSSSGERVLIPKHRVISAVESMDLEDRMVATADDGRGAQEQASDLDGWDPEPEVFKGS